ncbi:MAG: type II toxin-antitoxin system VapB family antitoxin [Chloroflexi bacterium]|nr:MAG: type II toxin-antitoxin system VapB family antitoxin [Chloroflexota bacterium]
MSKTNVVVDDALVRRVMRLYRLPTKRAAIDFALRALVGNGRRRDMLDVEGAGGASLPRAAAPSGREQVSSPIPFGGTATSSAPRCAAACPGRCSPARSSR